jgi:release factor glutamine methyltransferase
MTIAHFLRETTAQFEAAGIMSARLDAQVLLERALKQNKAWLLAHGEDRIDDEKLPLLQEQARRRAARQPLAYILGRQEFYGRTFVVTPAVLIPRPETETIIDELKKLPLPDGARVLDVGTGSGAIAITAELELPHLRTEACDISPEALGVATQNAERLGAHVHFFASDLLARAEHTYDTIIANLPYVADDWERSPETNFEPRMALFAEDTGLALIKKLLEQTPAYLTKNGYLILEADPRQFARIKKAAAASFTFVRSEGFVLILQKKTSS